MTETTKKELEVTEKKAIQKTDGEPTREGLMWVPDVDIYQERDNTVLQADLPGVRRDDIDIQVHDGVLTLMAPQSDVPQNWRAVYSEYSPGGYSRRFTLGEQIDQTKIAAKMENGVLTLTLPKAEAHKPKKIEIR